MQISGMFLILCHFRLSLTHDTHTVCSELLFFCLRAYIFTPDFSILNTT